MIFTLTDNAAAVFCESCEQALATYLGIDEDRSFMVCERCVPRQTRIPAQVAP